MLIGDKVSIELDVQLVAPVSFPTRQGSTDSDPLSG
jgi:hypothetical protein